MKTWFVCLLAAGTLVSYACQSNSAETASIVNNHAEKEEQTVMTSGKLYLKTYFYTTMYGSSLDISWIYLGSDGTVVRNPKHGVDPINIKAEMKDNEKNVGKYTVKGNAIEVSWANGNKSTWKTTSKNGDYETIDGGIVSRQKGMPENYRIAGNYTASSFLPGLSSVHKLVFNKDGSFRLNRSGAIATGDVATTSESSDSGTYHITGNTLTLNFSDGTKKVSLICIWDDGDKKNLVINSSYFPQQS